MVTFVKYAAIFHLDSDFGNPATAQTLISWQIKTTQNSLLCQFLFASRSIDLLLVNITADSVLMLTRVCTTHIWSGAHVTRGDSLFANARPDHLWLRRMRRPLVGAFGGGLHVRHCIIPSVYALNGRCGCARARSWITKRTFGSCKSLLLLGLREDAAIHRQFKETKAAYDACEWWIWKERITGCQAEMRCALNVPRRR